jgi:hypothetical protein
VAPRAAYYRLKSLWGPAALRVASPNGGENFRTRTFQTIRWTYSGNPGSLVRIELLRNGKAFSTLSRSTSLGNNGSGSFTWYVSSLIKTGEDYQIRVISLTDSRYMDVSDASFTITNR